MVVGGSPVANSERGRKHRINEIGLTKNVIKEVFTGEQNPALGR